MQYVMHLVSVWLYMYSRSHNFVICIGAFMQASSGQDVYMCMFILNTHAHTHTHTHTHTRTHTHTHANTQNYELKTAQTGHRKALVQQATQYEREQADKEEISQEMVEEAMWEKLQLARDTQAELQGQCD